MPYIYTHDTFGKKVSEKLPKELQNIISAYPDEFATGLQGPDILFFYYPFLKLRTNQLGYWQHKNSFAPFLKRAVRIIQKEGIESGVYAYILGFICHFTLDSECHSFVIPLSEKPGYHHHAIENEFDRHLMKKDGYKEFSYPLWKMVKWQKHVVDAVHKAYQPFHIPKIHIRTALLIMSFVKWFLGGGRCIRRVLVRLVMLLSFQYKKLEGFMMSLKPKKYAKKTNQSLQYLFDNAITLTSELLQDFHESVQTGKPLNKRFYTNFKNNDSLL